VLGGRDVRNTLIFIQTNFAGNHKGFRCFSPDLLVESRRRFRILNFTTVFIVCGTKPNWVRKENNMSLGLRPQYDNITPIHYHYNVFRVILLSVFGSNSLHIPPNCDPSSHAILQHIFSIKSTRLRMFVHHVVVCTRHPNIIWNFVNSRAAHVKG